MTTNELQQLRNILVLRRSALIDRLTTDESDIIEPAFIRLLADTHVAISAIDAALAESITAGDEP